MRAEGLAHGADALAAPWYMQAAHVVLERGR